VQTLVCWSANFSLLLLINKTAYIIPCLVPIRTSFSELQRIYEYIENPVYLGILIYYILSANKNISCKLRQWGCWIWL